MSYSLILEQGESFHVNAPTKNEDGEERAALHYMLDPGDGLCSTLVDDLPLDVAQLFAAAPLLETAAHAAAAFLSRAHHLDACQGWKAGIGCVCGLTSTRKAVDAARAKLRERPDTNDR